MAYAYRGSALPKVLLTTILIASPYLASAADDDAFFKENSGSSSSDPSNPSTPDPNQEGAAGPSKSGINLSRGTIIAISVVVGCIAVLAIASAILFYVAKKRQWEVRKSIRRSTKRITTTIKAHTPVRANFSRRDKAVMRIDPPASRNDRTMDGGDRRAARIYKDSNRDLEKGSVTTKTRLDVPPARKATFDQARSATGHGNRTHIESGNEEKSQGGSWTTRFGRRS